MRLADVTTATRLSKSTIYKLSQERRFPKPFKIPGTHAARWREAEVAAWMAHVDGRARASAPSAAATTFEASCGKA